MRLKITQFLAEFLTRGCWLKFLIAAAVYVLLAVGFNLYRWSVIASVVLGARPFFSFFKNLYLSSFVWGTRRYGVSVSSSLTATVIWLQSSQFMADRSVIVSCKFRNLLIAPRWSRRCRRRLSYSEMPLKLSPINIRHEKNLSYKTLRKLSPISIRHEKNPIYKSATKTIPHLCSPRKESHLQKHHENLFKSDSFRGVFVGEILFVANIDAGWFPWHFYTWDCFRGECWWRIVFVAFSRWDSFRDQYLCGIVFVRAGDIL